MGKRKNANEWKSKLFSKFEDMVLIKGEDRTDEICDIQIEREDFYGWIVDFINGDEEYYKLDEIKILQHPIKEKIEDKRIYIGNAQISKVSLFLYFGNNVRIIYKNGDYQTVDRRLLNVCDKFNRIDGSAYKPYTYNLEPDDNQKKNIDKKIEKSQIEEKKAGKVYSYEPNKPIGDIIKYKNQIIYVDVEDVGCVEIKLTDNPIGNCHVIHVKKIENEYLITFYCYKRVVGIDLGEKAVICSTGEKYELSHFDLKEKEKYKEIKQQWKESVAIQLLLEYDILFMEYLESDDNTSLEFDDMIKFSKILIEKAEIFNKGNPKETYKKEIHVLKEKFPSTQICHVCGYQNEDLRGDLQKRIWVCPYCGTKHDRDVNAAINILRRGMEEKMEN